MKQFYSNSFPEVQIKKLLTKLQSKPKLPNLSSHEITFSLIGAVLRIRIRKNQQLFAGSESGTRGYGSGYVTRGYGSGSGTGLEPQQK
jgi:hypothetical protein